MNEIRNKEQYIGKYEYCDKDGKCVLIEPEVENTGVPFDTNVLFDGEVITTANLNHYNGVFDPVIEAITDYLYGVAIPTDLASDIALAIDQYVQEGNIVECFYDVVMALADAAQVREWKLLLELLKIGVELTENETNAKIEVGDTLIRYVNTSSPMFDLYIVLDSNGKFKTCYKK